MTALRNAGNMVGVSKTLDFPKLRGASGPGLLPEIDAEAGTEALAANFSHE